MAAKKKPTKKPVVRTDRHEALVRRIRAVRDDANRRGQKPLEDLCGLLIEEFSAR